MADFHYTHGMGALGYEAAGNSVSNNSPNYLTNLTNFMASGLSAALIVGVSVWGYQLMMRDVTGLPVVQAQQGDMRVVPDNPGGQLALNQGLSVNEVAASGTVAVPTDTLVLAPKPIQLATEDMPVSTSLVALVQQPTPLDLFAPTVDQSVGVTGNNGGQAQSTSVEDLIRQLSAGVKPIEAINTVSGAKVVTVVAPATAVGTPQLPKIQSPGLRLSLRPSLRPATGPAVVIAVATPAKTATTDVDAGSIPAGTRLVQLGAFDSAEVAYSQWDKIEGRFGDFLQGKSRIVQKAKSSGRTFYRLRAMGFEDLSDARRFCSALLAEKADCIPVVTR